MNRLAPVAVAAAAVLWPVVAHARDEVIVMTIPFAGEPRLGANVATVFNLQIWMTFRKAPSPNPKKLDFGDAVAEWVDDKAPSSHEEAEAVAAHRSGSADVILWGNVERYGTGLIVQGYLTLPEHSPDHRETHEVWQVEGGPGRPSVTLDLPARRYEFAPFELKAALAEKYRSFEGVPMFDDAGHVIGKVEDDMLALKVEDNRVKVLSKGRRGWLRLDDVAGNRGAVVDFVSGIARIFRADWQGATSTFAKVTNSTDANNEIRVDAWLYRALAKEKNGQRGTAELAKAEALNPLSKTVLKYRLMSDLAEWKRLRDKRPDDPAARGLLASIQQRLEENASILSQNDPFVRALSALLRAEHARLQSDSGTNGGTGG